MNKQEPFQGILGKRLSRRSVLQQGAMLSASSFLTGCIWDKEPANKPTNSQLTFSELPQGLDKNLSVPVGYQSQVLIRWGDPLFEDVEDFDPYQQTASKQAKQFGFNNDFIGFLPLTSETEQSEHGLLVINHEYTNPTLMFPNSPDKTELTLDQTNIDIMAHGMSVIEVKKKNNQWHVIKNSNYTRRITPHTPMKLSGPASGNQRLVTAISSDGIDTLGTYGNCSGGITPWGTILSGEENVDSMFSGDYSNSSEKESHKRFGMKQRAKKSWSRHYSRWDMNKQPNEPFHAGWVVEIDPYNPNSTPKKRTALGRFKHEGCNIFINQDKHVIAYCGDDEKFEYLYKFVSKNKYQPYNRQENLDLLDEGTLYCARFYDDGRVVWLPLVYGKAPLTKNNGFNNQGDVLIDARKAADLLGATPMDRPEDVKTNPTTSRVYVMLTNNDERKQEQVDAANPRANNQAGQIIELLPPKDDHTANEFQWDMFLIAGKLNDHLTNYHPDTTENGWLASPDNCTFDSLGNLWIATDGAEDFGVADGIWVSEVEGPNRQLTKRFLRTPIGAELCGPCFTQNTKNLFCSIQHPGGKSTFEKPTTRWPDFDEKIPPRPAVIVITKDDDGRIGS